MLTISSYFAFTCILHIERLDVVPYVKTYSCSLNIIWGGVGSLVIYSDQREGDKSREFGKLYKKVMICSLLLVLLYW
jgi:hypothetical protein